jgi:aminopeptidase N
MVVAATGVEIDRRDARGTVTRRFVSGPSRDFTAVASTDFETVSREVNGTIITSYFRPESADGGKAVLDFAGSSLALFSSLLSSYPYRELDVVEVELYGAAGVEFPQLVFLAHNIYGGSARNEHYLEFVTAHEVVHQWLYGLIGNNQHHAAFIDEGLSEYLSSEVYFSAVYGPKTGRRQFALEVLHWYLSYLQSGSDLVVDQPTDSFRSVASYSVIVYAKGAIGFAQLRDVIGDEAFFAALRSYASQYEFGIATPADLRAAFAGASGRDVGTVWRTWFESARGTELFSPEDYQELLVELGLR